MKHNHRTSPQDSHRLLQFSRYECQLRPILPREAEHRGAACLLIFSCIRAEKKNHIPFYNICVRWRRRRWQHGWGIAYLNIHDSQLLATHIEYTHTKEVEKSELRGLAFVYNERNFSLPSVRLFVRIFWCCCCIACVARAVYSVLSATKRLK